MKKTSKKGWLEAVEPYPNMQPSFITLWSQNSRGDNRRGLVTKAPDRTESGEASPALRSRAQEFNTPTDLPVLHFQPLANLS